jgi:hypothetical protein
MSATKTDLSTLRREVWVQQEGCETVRLFTKSDTNIIEDWKLLGLGDSRKDYHAFYLQHHLLNIILFQLMFLLKNPSNSNASKIVIVCVFSAVSKSITGSLLLYHTFIVSYIYKGWYWQWYRSQRCFNATIQRHKK